MKDKIGFKVQDIEKYFLIHLTTTIYGINLELEYKNGRQAYEKSNIRSYR